MRRSSVSGLLVALSLLAVAGLGIWASKEAPTTVIVVRHGEKALDAGDDPDLTEKGRARAERLATMLGHSGVDALFATEYRRTRATLEPLARKVGVDVTTRAAADSGDLVETIRDEHREKTIVIAGHSNTVPEIVSRLSGQAIEPIADDEYDRLFVIHLRRWGPSSVLALRF